MSRSALWFSFRDLAHLLVFAFFLTRWCASKRAVVRRLLAQRVLDSAVANCLANER
nr:MAG: hypothetical protein [Molluscum contagiosum virus]